MKMQFIEEDSQSESDYETAIEMQVLIISE